MPDVESIQPYLEPIRKTVVVRRTPAEAFEIFTARITEWWPRARYSIHQAECAACGIEPRAGGEIWEQSQGGARERWGTVLAWDPPRRLVMSWHPGRDPATAQEVELRFVAVAEGTRVELEHRDWARLGARAEETRTGYDHGWSEVFGRRYVEACS